MGVPDRAWIEGRIVDERDAQLVARVRGDRQQERRCTEVIDELLDDYWPRSEYKPRIPPTPRSRSVSAPGG